MINKFQQGGILAQIQQLPKDQQQQLMQAFSQWAQQKGIDIQAIQQDPKQLEQALGMFMEEMQAQKIQSAKHGAKLNYLKSLKHQCAEDEEVVYFKNGGSVGCGCQKKKGGEIEKAQNGTKAVKKFKNDYSSKKVKDSEDDYFKGTADHTRPENKTTKPVQKFKKRTKEEQAKIDKQSEEDYFKGVADHTRPGKKCDGGAVTKFKKHRQGGSLNRIPFISKVHQE